MQPLVFFLFFSFLSSRSFFFSFPFPSLQWFWSFSGLRDVPFDTFSLKWLQISLGWFSKYRLDIKVYITGKKIPQHECVIFICRVHVLFFFETDPELGVIPQSASWAQMVGRKRSAKELRALWRKAIMEQILLIRMERENNSLQGIFPLFWFSLCVGVLVLSKQEPGGH